jgi:hypothetical protein
MWFTIVQLSLLMFDEIALNETCFNEFNHFLHILRLFPYSNMAINIEDKQRWEKRRPRVTLYLKIVNMKSKVHQELFYDKLRARIGYLFCYRIDQIVCVVHLNWITMHVMLSQPMPPEEATSVAMILSKTSSMADDTGLSFFLLTRRSPTQSTAS